MSANSKIGSSHRKIALGKARRAERAFIDPISVAVIANRLSAITKEVGQIMLLTSRSPIFSESRDFVTAVFGAQGRLVAQTSHIPLLLGALPFALEAIRNKVSVEDLRPGAVVVANDPYQG